MSRQVVRVAAVVLAVCAGAEKLDHTDGQPARGGLLAVAAGGAAAFGSFNALYLTSATRDADPLRYVALMTGIVGVKGAISAPRL